LLHAQQTITGSISDADGNPIPGATVIISGTSQGTTSDFDGNFSISADAQATLEFSSIGFETQTIAINGQNNLTISLQDAVSQLDEIIVTGYGTQTRGELTGSVVTVDVSDAVKVPVVNAAEVLQGRVSGVSVVTNGQPGSAPSVRIRGFASPNNNDPLYIIDGVQTRDAFVLNSINPADIDQINVLKDGAAAIYGSRASNGVIIITTKSGKGLSEPKVSLEISTGMSNATNLPELLNAQQLGQVIWDSRINDGAATTHPQFGSGASPVVPKSLQGVSVPTTVNPNGTEWLGAIFQAAPTHNISLSVQNGTEKTNSLFSLNYLKRDGIQIETGYERVGIRANSEYKVGKVWTVGEHINITLDEERNGNQVQAALRSSPLIPLRDNNGDFAGIYVTSLGLGNVNTPYATLIRAKDDYNKSLRVIGDIFVQAQITPELTFKSSFGGPYLPKKNVYTKGDDANIGKGGWGQQLSGINYHIMRYADVLLMAAEAAVETSDLEKGRNYVNQIRTRAMNMTTVKAADGSDAANYEMNTYDAPWTDQATAQKAVRFERRLELAMEGHRTFDLRRWGVAESVIARYIAKESEVITPFAKGQVFESKHNVFPIPLSAIDGSGGVIQQNPGY
jgi:TonB-dependent starch-binding outer membrane protein SusC